MLAYRKGLDWEVRAPAKLNLWFEVLSRRADGFHEIATLMVPIAWRDTLALRSDSGGLISLKCTTAAPGLAPTLWADLPEDDRNLVVRALHLLQLRSGTKLGASVRLTKRIPAAAGLGGGSSDAAAALVAANVGWNLNWTRQQLAELAAELGSDVPFFLYRQAAICRGRGERVSPVQGLGRLHFVVVRPPEGLSTAEVYRDCRPSACPAEPESLVSALQRGNLSQAGGLMINRLQVAAQGLSARIEELQAAFTACDVPGHQMSGSGSSYFGLCRSARHAQVVAGRLRQKRPGYVRAVSSCRQ
jgi:4-diphosphocytidyl-2-C-methyl-D-erythritol kinase